MIENIFRSIIIAIAVLFTAFFCVVVVPPLVENSDIGIFPGVAVGFALYLLLRQHQLKGRGNFNA